MKVGVAGCAGRMGRKLLSSIVDRSEFELSGGTEKLGSKFIGQRIGSLIEREHPAILVESDAKVVFEKSDAIIDFTLPDATLKHVQLAAETRTALIIGTTGIDEKIQISIEEAALDTTIVQAGNMSLGINVLIGLAEQGARALGKEWDVEIVEMHHRNKVDAPSGTALMLGRAAARGLGFNHEEVAEFGRQGNDSARKKSSIGYAAMRGGDVIGEHSIIFAGLGEQLEFSHKASDRALFVNGALYAALWTLGKPSGLFNMRDVLGLS